MSKDNPIHNVNQDLPDRYLSSADKLRIQQLVHSRTWLKLNSRCKASELLRQDRTDHSDPLLYLYSNNSDETLNILQPYQKKAVHVLYANCDKFINEIGLDNVGFLTLTFPDNVTDHKEASRRFDNMRRRFLSEHFGKWMWVKERQKRGAWHFHILIDCKLNIREGINFEEIGNGNYRSANNSLRNLWKTIRTETKKYGFGRTELLPVKSNTEGMARYVGKYISNHTENRKPIDKGVRLTGYSKDFIRSSPKFAWNTENAKKWRANVKLFFTHIMGYPESMHELATKILKDRFGPSWAYHLQDEIMNIEETIERGFKNKISSLPDAPF